ncbi:MAG: hypothetical protein ACXVJ7_03950 [Acidimicrobiia bacterium]
MRLLAGAIVAALLTTVGLVLVTQLWDEPLHEPFQYALYPGDDQQDATLELMLVKNIHEAGWFTTNPKLNAPFKQEWAEWPMGGDLVAYVIKKGLVDATGDVPLTLNLFWLLTFPLAALIAYPTLRSLRVSPATAVLGAALFALAPYHFRNGTGHSNLAFYAGVPVIVLACVRLLGPPGALPTGRDLRTRRGWRQLRWLLLGAAFIAVTGLYYLAFLLTMVAICGLIGAAATRRWDRLLVGALIGAAGLATSVLANLPTLSFRWSHAANLLGVPERERAVSEDFPLRLVELVSPVDGHRLPPFAALAKALSPPGQFGLGTANLGIIATVGFVAGLALLVGRVVRPGPRARFALESRLGLVMLVALLLGIGGGIGRGLELLGLQDVRAWPRIAIVIAFAAIAVVARLLDRVRASRWIRRRALAAPVWIGALALVLVVGVLDQTSGALLPDVAPHAAAWDADARFVARLERRLPRDAMVFQLPISDFPARDLAYRMSAHDLVKEGYLHSRTLRWSSGGVRGRTAEWQWAAARLRTRTFVRGLAAMGFAAIVLDRFGYADGGADKIAKISALAGPPVVSEGDRLVAWDLARAAPSLLAGLDAGSRARLARRMLTMPRLYLSTDARARVDRGDTHPVCAEALIQLVNPRHGTVDTAFEVRVDTGRGATPAASLRTGGRRVPIPPELWARVPVRLRPGRTAVTVHVETPNVRCDNVPNDSLPTISARFPR